MAVTTDIKSAADLRAVLDDLLQAHVYLASNATGAALGGRQDEMQAASAALDDNTQALGQVIGAAYGPQAQQQFLQLWRAHIGFFVDYAQADAAGDTAKKQKAESDLDGYRQQFDDFITGANPNLPKGSVAALLTPHVQTLEAVIDAQAAKDPTKAYTQLKMAADHMHMVGDPLAEAVAKQFPQTFPAPAADSKAADLQSTLNLGLQEHVYLTHDATSEAMRGDTAGFQAAAAALDQNTTELGQAIGSVYGDQAQQQFLQLWKAHIGFFVNYTQAVAAGDQAQQQQATSDLGGYATSFDTFITGANPNLPKGSVAQLLQPHITGLEAMIDDEHAKNYPAEYQQTVDAARHMWMIGNALASAIQQQFPDKFPTS